MEQEKTYFQQFCEEYHITPENNKIKLKIPVHVFDKDIEQDFEIYAEDEEGNIDMLLYDLEKFVFPIPKDENQKDYYQRYFYYTIKRYKTPKEVTDKKTGKTKIKKYNFPGNTDTHPFFPPELVRKYEQGEKINTLVLTEGHKKARYAALFGLDIVGLGSITHYKEKYTQQMYSDIIRIIKKCDVKNIVILYDGDCLDISENDLKTEKDLYKRPNGFLNSANAIRELLKDYEIDIYFSHILSDSLPSKPKGLDDILQDIRKEQPGEELPEMAVINEITTFSRKGNYIYKENITRNSSKLFQHFNLQSVEVFYLFHAEKIKFQEFIYQGTKYQYDEKTCKCNIMRPAEANDYFRVGDTFYKYVDVPNKYEQLERSFQKRMKGTIIDDYGKTFVGHVAKYEAFCNVPSHDKYDPVLSNCFNVYSRFEHVAEEGSIENSLFFAKHIFEDQYEIGLDYIQLLYQQPTQVLPILCLVSNENNTGKSTFVKWMKAIFTGNCTIIGNDQMNDQFNGNWATKLLIACEESFIEKQAVMEKIKALSTGDKIGLRMMQKDPVEIDFFGKFILCSNKEKNFIIASQYDIRFWVRKVKAPEKLIVNMQNKLLAEIPAFLHFLNNRKLTTTQESRMWFNPALLFTKALQTLIEANKPKIEKELIYRLTEMFVETSEPTLYIAMKDIQESILCKKYEATYIKEILERLGFDRYMQNNKYSQLRYRKFTKLEDGTFRVETIKGYPYVFERKNVITEDEFSKFALEKIENCSPFVVDGAEGVDFSEIQPELPL